ADVRGHDAETRYKFGNLTMLTAHQRIERQKSSPALVRLHQALSRLRSTVTLMHTGAHPDDEQSGLLAYMRFGLGMQVVIACSTRGEGGQNALGPERGGALGVLRSREMEEAARVIDADIARLGHGPDEPAHEYGIPKSGADTLAHWGEERTHHRLVRAHRQILLENLNPTFLDVPGQHGHHRAMTRAAEAALALAADPAAFPEHAREGLAPWRGRKFYLPAWSGGDNGYYDDEVPPPPETVRIVAGGDDFATGLPFHRLGEVSRAFHASQNMGHWHVGGSREWPLHLVGGGAEASIFEGLPARLADCGAAGELAAADAAIERALAAFPARDAVLDALRDAKTALRAAKLSESERAGHGHRIERKLAEIDAAMALAAGISVQASVSSADIEPGGQVDLVIEVERGLAESITVTPQLSGDFAPVAAQACNEVRTVLPLRAKADAAIGNAFAPAWSSLGGNGAVSVLVEARVAGDVLRFFVDVEEAVQVSPAHSLAISPDALILKLPSNERRRIAIKPAAAIGHTQIAGVPGLAVVMDGEGAELAVGNDLAPGRYQLPPTVDGVDAYSTSPIAYPRIGRTRVVRRLTLDVLALDLALPEARVGYIGGGSDRVGLWLERMGADPVMLDETALAGDI